ncbi:MAG: cell surface protein SprA [Flammeovirgaceae bacterium]|nr:cell surface protein SprA [Flammeovirgaceae bacterium]
MVFISNSHPAIRRKVGDINGFKSIRYIRMYMTDFVEPVVLRFANFRTVGNRWRRYTANLEEARFGEPLEPNLDNFSVSVVNIEENGLGNDEKPSYVEPLARDRDITSVQQRRLNEQSVQLCVDELPDGDARAIFKNVSMDFFNYGRIKMFLSAHGTNLNDNELVGFIRLGTDFDENYYEIELPLTITPPGTSRDPSIIWPEQNQIDLELNNLYALKVQRDRLNYPLGQLYPLDGPKQVDKHGIRILGRPDLSSVTLMMIGVRNPRSSDARPLSVCIWADELRLTDFDRSAGYAFNSVLNMKLADLGSVTGSFRFISFGYGGVQSKIYERARSATTAYDISASLNLDKFFPQSAGLVIPMFISYENLTLDPKYDPANPDLRIQAVEASFATQEEADNYLALIQDRTTRKSLNFTNVRKTKTNTESKSHFWDIENFGFTYAYAESQQTNFNLIENLRKNYKGAVAWQWAPKFQGFSPFQESKILSSPWLQLIKDFNFNPLFTNLSLRGDLDRSFNKIVYRNSSSDEASKQPNYQKFFVFNRLANARWAFSKSLTFDYVMRVNAIIDEPEGDIDTQEKKDSVMYNLKNFGRKKNFEQNLTLNYAIPLEKFPLTSFMGADYRYNVAYSWRAGPVNQVDSLQLGNIIQNGQDQSLTGRIDLVKLYNKVGFLKGINNPRPPPPASQRPSNVPDTIKKPPDLKAVKGLLRLIMSIRNITGNYTLTRGTILPGFAPSPYLFGMDKNWEAPGWNFILGGQDPNIRFDAADNGWLITSNKLTTPFSQLENKDYGLKANIEPTTDFKIQLDMKKTTTSSFQEIYRFEPDSGRYVSLSPSQTGSYKISTIAINTAFKNNTDLNSEVFQEFIDNIAIIQNRFSSINGAGYETKSQDVIIPAFISAYTGKDANTTNLSPFPNTPLPNWRIDYTGLIKLGNLKDKFQSITLNHAYVSSYGVLNYSNSLEYNDVGLDIPVEDYNRNAFASKVNNSGDLIPIYVIREAVITEQFSPLIGINMRTKTRFTARFEYKKKRDLALNISNAQITEVNGKDWSLEIGYTKKNMKMPFKDQGRIITLKNDITFRLNMSVTNNQTIQRKIDAEDVTTNGNINVQIRPNISYVVNQKLNIQLYYDQNINEPLVTNSFPRTTTRFGTKILFNLSQ